MLTTAAFELVQQLYHATEIDVVQPMRLAHSLISHSWQNEDNFSDKVYGAPFVKILYLTDLAQKLLSLCIYTYLCADLAISAHIQLSLRRFSYLCADLAISAHI